MVASAIQSTDANIAFLDVSDMRGWPDLRLKDGDVCHLLGNASVGDGGGGLFYWDDDASDSENGAGSGASKAPGTIVKPTNTVTGRWKRVDSAVKDARWFGAVGNDSQNNLSAFQAAITAATGSSILIPAGIYVCNGSVSIPSNVTIKGAGVGKTIIKVSSGEVNNLLDALNESNIAIDGIEFQGNSTATTSAAAGAIRIRMSDDATADCSGFRITNCKFYNFKQDYWVYFLGDSDTYDLKDIVIDGCHFESASGNDRDTTSIGVPSTNIAFRGAILGASDAGVVRDFTVSNCYSEGSYIKRFVDCWSSVKNGVIESNKLYNHGANSNDNTGRYSVLIYSDRSIYQSYGAEYDPSAITVRDNKIDGGRDCGVYTASARNCVIAANSISNQTSTANSSIPKGGVAINSGTGNRIEGNILTSNAIDIGHSMLNSAGEDLVNYFSYNQCLSSSDVGVRVSGNTNATDRASAFFDENEIKGTVVNLLIAESKNSRISYRGGAIRESSADGFRVAVSATPTSPGDYVISVDGVLFEDIGSDAVIVPTTNIEVQVRNCLFDMGTIADHAISAASSELVAIDYNHFYTSTGSVTAGNYCLSCSGAEFTAVGNTFREIPTANLITGFSAPAWTATEGAYVQNFRKTETGTASSKYITHGYVYEGGAGAWVEDRRLTGN